MAARNGTRRTVAVAPSNEVYKIADVGQSVVLGIDVGGKFGVTETPLGTNVGLRASTSQRFQFEVSMAITLRKVVGAPVGIGGAAWKMFRQNEPLDQAHNLLQLVLGARAGRGDALHGDVVGQAGWVARHPPGCEVLAVRWPASDRMRFGPL